MFFVIIFFLIKVEVKIVNIEKDTKVYIKLLPLLKFSINLSFFIKIFLTNKENREKLSIREAIENYKKYQESKDVFNDFLKYIIVKEIHVNTLPSKELYEEYYILYSYNLLLYQYISQILRNRTKKVIKESYVINYNNNELLDIDFKCIFTIKYTHIIYVLLKNIKEIPSLIKRFT